MDNITYLLYSHHDYKDVLDIHIKQLEKFLPNINTVIAYNNIKYINDKYSKYKTIEYDENKIYGERVKYILSNITTKYVIYAHDMNILIDYPKKDIIKNVIEFMDKENVDQTRMFVAAINNPIYNEELFHLITKDTYYKFSVNTAIWKTESLYSIFDKFSSHSYRCMECDPIQDFVSTMKNYYISSEYDIKLEGEGFVISHNFPFCHFTHGGKWLMSFNNKHTMYIKQILDENNIDISIRGTT